MKRLRTIKQVITEVKTADPDSALTEHHLRSLIREGRLPVHLAGRKQLIDLDDLRAVLCGFEPQGATKQATKTMPIRKHMRQIRS